LHPGCFFYAVDLAHKFGLTAEQFGENLRDNYQRHDVEQDPAEPLVLAEQYISK
jgi:transcription elongation factor SPT6